MNLLRGIDIEYPETYQSLKQCKGLYVFMSEENYAFADFMRFVPSYKYLPFLEKVAFDSEVRKTQKDISQWRIPYLLGIARKVFREYCKP